MNEDSLKIGRRREEEFCQQEESKVGIRGAVAMNFY